LQLLHSLHLSLALLKTKLHLLLMQKLALPHLLLTQPRLPHLLLMQKPATRLLHLLLVSNSSRDLSTFFMMVEELAVCAAGSFNFIFTGNFVLTGFWERVVADWRCFSGEHHRSQLFCR
jgi:hypothetical protein